MSKLMEFIKLNKVLIAIACLLFSGIFTGVFLIIINHESRAEIIDASSVYCSYNPYYDTLLTNDDFEIIEETVDGETKLTYYLKAGFDSFDANFAFSPDLFFEPGSIVDFSYYTDGERNEINYMNICLNNSNAFYSDTENISVNIVSTVYISTSGNDIVNADFHLGDQNYYSEYYVEQSSYYVFNGIDFTTLDNSHEIGTITVHEHKSTLELNYVTYNNVGRYSTSVDSGHDGDTYYIDFDTDYSQSFISTDFINSAQEYFTLEINNSSLNYTGDMDVELNNQIETINIPGPLVNIRPYNGNEFLSLNVSSSDTHGVVFADGSVYFNDSNHQGTIYYGRNVSLYYSDFTSNHLGAAIAHNGIDEYYYSHMDYDISNSSINNSGLFKVSGEFGLAEDTVISINEDIAFSGPNDAHIYYSSFDGNIGFNAGVFDLPNDLSITNSSFTNNESLNGGGALNLNGGDVSISDSIFDGNVSYGKDGGGAIFAGDDVYLDIIYSTFTNNTSIYNGGAISLNGAFGYFEGGNISYNRSLGALNDVNVHGGGLYVGNSDYHEGYASLIDVDIQNNTTGSNAFSGTGGGVYSEAGAEIDLEGNVVLTNNVAYSLDTSCYQNNLMLDSNNLFYVNDSLLTGSRIGVSTSIIPNGSTNIEIVNGGPSYSLNTDDINYLYSDLGYNIELINNSGFLTTLNSSFVPDDGFDDKFNLCSVIKYKVTFDANGGKNAPQPVMINENESVNEPSIDPSRDGYTFTGWYTDNDFKTKYVFSDLVSSHITLYAGWEKEVVEYTVTFNLNGATGNNFTEKVIEGEKVGEPTSDPKRDGYIFLGWFNNSAATNEYNFSTEITSNKVLYAGWRKEVEPLKEYTVTFNLNGATGNNFSSKVTEGDKVDEPTSDPKREGYTFLGWFTNSAATNKYNFNTEITSNRVLYAGWKKNEVVVPEKYNVTFDMNGGVSNDFTIVVEENDLVTKPEENPTREGFDFTGWYTDEAALIGYNFDSKVTKSITLYAGWKELSDNLIYYTVTFDSKGGSLVPDAQEVEEGARAVKPFEIPLVEDYNFAGWYIDEEGTELFDFDTRIYQPITLYASYKEAEEIVDFEDDGEDIPEIKIEIEDGYVKKPDVVPEKEGFEFVGWYEDEELTIEYDFLNNRVDGPITIYAKYRPITQEETVTSSWSMLNVLFVAVTVLISIVSAIVYGKNDDRRAFKWIIIFVPLVASSLLFIFTQRLEGESILIDGFTLFFGAITIIQLLVTIIYRNSIKNDNEKVS